MALVLTLQNISKSYGLQAVLRGVDAVIAPGWRVGVIGRNGAGKSTLARIIAGTETADGGQINRDPSLRLAHLEQHAEFQADETALEYLMRVSGRPEWECAKMADRFGFRKTAAAEGADAPLDSMFTAAARLSGGRATRPRFPATPFSWSPRNRPTSSTCRRSFSWRLISAPLTAAPCSSFRMTANS